MEDDSYHKQLNDQEVTWEGRCRADLLEIIKAHGRLLKGPYVGGSSWDLWPPNGDTMGYDGNNGLKCVCIYIYMYMCV